MREREREIERCEIKRDSEREGEIGKGVRNGDGGIEGSEREMESGERGRGRLRKMEIEGEGEGDRGRGIHIKR